MLPLFFFALSHSQHLTQPTQMSRAGRAVVVVLGCTGSGKSKLAIDLATRFNGEIIGSDAMQVRGADACWRRLVKQRARMSLCVCVCVCVCICV
jgi:hypothetical protein